MCFFISFIRWIAISYSRFSCKSFISRHTPKTVFKSPWSKNLTNCVMLLSYCRPTNIPRGPLLSTRIHTYASSIVFCQPPTSSIVFLSTSASSIVFCSTAVTLHNYPFPMFTFCCLALLACLFCERHTYPYMTNLKNKRVYQAVLHYSKTYK